MEEHIAPPGKGDPFVQTRIIAQNLIYNKIRGISPVCRHTSGTGVCGWRGYVVLRTHLLVWAWKWLKVIFDEIKRNFAGLPSYNSVCRGWRGMCVISVHAKLFANNCSQENCAHWKLFVQEIFRKKRLFSQQSVSLLALPRRHLMEARSQHLPALLPSSKNA